MYLSHWGLAESPFASNRDANSFFAAPAQDEALARLQFLVDNRHRLGLLCGGRGLGKSLLLDVFAAQLHRDGCDVAKTSLVGRSTRELLWEIVVDLGVAPNRDASDITLWGALADRVAENRWQKIPTILLLDDADEAAPDVATTLTRLVELDTSADARWTVVLATSENGYRKINERLLDQVTLRVDLAPWSAGDTLEYVRATLSASGGDPSIVDESALRKLHDLAGGSPRRINRLVDLALVAGAGQQLSRLDASVIESAAELATV